MASYGDSWTPKVAKIVRQQWVSMVNLENLVTSLEGINFSLQSERNNGFEMLTKLTLVRDIASKTKRFDEEAILVHMNGLDWPGKFRQVRSALEYKPPENAFIGGNKNDKTREGANISRQKDTSDDVSQLNLPLQEREKFDRSKVAFDTGLEKMRSQIGSFSGVYTQYDFEQEFSLRWKEAGKTNPPDDE